MKRLISKRVYVKFETNASFYCVRFNSHRTKHKKTLAYTITGYHRRWQWMAVLYRVSNHPPPSIADSIKMRVGYTSVILRGIRLYRVNSKFEFLRQKQSNVHYMLHYQGSVWWNWMWSVISQFLQNTLCCSPNWTCLLCCKYSFAFPSPSGAICSKVAKLMGHNPGSIIGKRLSETLTTATF